MGVITMSLCSCFLLQVVMTVGQTSDVVSAMGDYSMVIPSNHSCCSICGCTQPTDAMKTVRTAGGHSDEICFHALARLQPAPGASRADDSNTLSCCQLCCNDLKLQWDGYEQGKIPMAARSFIVFRGPWSSVG